MFKVFPATYNHERQKVPLIVGWKDKATADQTKIAEWQAQYRDRINFWAAPCGSDNGILVLDVDLKPDQGHDGMKTIQENGFNLPPTWYQRTPSGGYHFFYKYDKNRDPGNKVKFLNGLDVRSQGGWAALYNLDQSAPLADMPDWIWQQCQKKQREVSPTAVDLYYPPEIVQEVFDHALSEIRNAPPGESNNTLNIQSYVVGQLIAMGSLNEEYAKNELFKAAKERGKPDYEAMATISSGIKNGIANPKKVEFPPNGPEILISLPKNIPAPNPVPERWTPRFITRSELLDRTKLRKPQLFENWSTEDIHLTSADGGTGKTTIKLYEAVCLALGLPFLGFRCVTPGRTLFITGEDTANKLSAMLGAILNQMKLFDNTPESNAQVEQVLSSIVIKKDADLCLISKDKQGFLTVNRDAMNKVLQAVEDLNPRMIVFDPIASFWGSESMVNDMNKAVAKFMGELQERSHACIEMINHIGKVSSSSKDLSQFAGRGGTGLPSHARVVRVLISLNEEEYKDKTGLELEEGKSAMLCNIGKFSDGSPLYGKPFVIVREGYLFHRQEVLAGKEKESQSLHNDVERVMMAIKNTCKNGHNATRSGITGLLRSEPDSIPATRVRDALSVLEMTGLYGEHVREVTNLDALGPTKVLIVENSEGVKL